MRDGWVGFFCSSVGRGDLHQGFPHDDARDAHGEDDNDETSSWRPFGPLDFVLRALRVLRPGRWARLESGPLFSTIFDHFRQFWTILDHFDRF